MALRAELVHQLTVGEQCAILLAEEDDGKAAA